MFSYQRFIDFLIPKLLKLSRPNRWLDKLQVSIIQDFQLKSDRLLIQSAEKTSEQESLASSASFLYFSFRVNSSSKRCSSISWYFCFISFSMFLQRILELNSLSRAASFSTFFVFLSEDALDLLSGCSFC